MAATSATAARARRANLRAVSAALPLVLSLLLLHSPRSACAKGTPPPPPPSLSSLFPFFSFGSITGGSLHFASPPPPRSRSPPPPPSPPPPSPPPPSTPPPSPPPPSPQQNPAKCNPSSLAASGFTSSKVLAPGFTYHWRASSGSVVQMALEADSARAKSWFGVGWTDGGNGGKTDAVFANVANGGVKSFTTSTVITPQKHGDPAPVTIMSETNTLNIGSAGSVGFGDSTIALFSRTEGTGSVTFQSSGPMNVVWYYPSWEGQPLGSNPKPVASAQVDFSCNGQMAGTPIGFAPAPSPTESPSPPPPPPSRPLPRLPLVHHSPTKGVLCPASTFSGYEYQLELGSGNYLLHWKFPSATVIDFLLEARSNTLIKDSWLAVGWSKKKGKMKGADAVIGNLPGVGAFVLGGYKAKDIQQTSSFSLGTTAVSTTTEGGTSITFSRTVGTGNVPLKLNTTSYLIWAFPQTITKTLGFHGTNQGGYAVDFACYQVPACLWACGPDYADDSDADKYYSRSVTAAGAADAAGITATALPDQPQGGSAAGAGAGVGDGAGGVTAGNRRSGVRFYDTVSVAGMTNGEWWQQRSP
ncbi:hypothetical protein CLOP_g10430 [Closterium sp. NIES-67]|nr:hypothetical protein CLOP_g10430 [Closterium sp. NIES-67]